MPPESNYSVKYPIQKTPSKYPSSKIAAQVASLKIEKKKYTTNIDSRNFLTVFEYVLGGNWVIWDYHHGLVFFTGLYKICNEGEKWDYLKIIDKYSVNNMSSVKRIRGGYLKIQGTWIPYKLAYEMASRFCYKYRYQLTPLFGEKFASDCVPPSLDKFKNFDKLNVPRFNTPLPATMKRRFSLSIEVSSKKKVEKKKRSKSFTSGDLIEDEDIAELKELLSASKQLHNFNNISRTPKNDTFNYAGFLWKFTNNDRNLNVLGKSDSSNDITKQQQPKIIINGVTKKPITPLASPKEETLIEFPITSPSLDINGSSLQGNGGSSLNLNSSITTTVSDDKNYTYTSNATTRIAPPQEEEEGEDDDDDDEDEEIQDMMIEAEGINEDDLIPQDFDGIETILIAASHLKTNRAKLDLWGLNNENKLNNTNIEKLRLESLRIDHGGDRVLINHSETNKENFGY
ncbi:hypothetical protein WICPIJ_003415 [Wickerhamomyces pijperi]|uniref:HTH APSES-type domain-containing protein n=1 Tax=Wickerhamomyces pijperi TaxID=599730 RepID=A0A9P8Q9W0_WICPI|nr:hypothetical protein WICPIJ_003415 [Wickerhamomyces pijperi]